MRDWRMYPELARALIRIALPLHADDDPVLAPDDTVHALDSSTIGLRTSVFPWALFRSTKSAVEVPILSDSCGNLPTFIHISDGKLRDAKVPDLLMPEPGASCVIKVWHRQA